MSIPEVSELVKRAELRDWYDDGAESAAFVGDQVIALSSLATTIVREVGEGRSIELNAIAQVLVTEFGYPDGDLAELVKEKVEELVSSGILVWVQ